MSTLISGLEAFMEDTSVEVDVEVGAPEEVIEEQAEAVQEEAEVAEETTEAEAESEQAEMIFREFDRVEGYLNHVKKYGVDRTFLSLLNSDGSLSQAIGYQLPACESFDVTGSVHSAESQAVIAGLEGIIGEVWNFIKKICAKIRDFFVTIWNNLAARLGNVDDQIGKLKKLSTDSNRVWSPNKASKYNTTRLDPNCISDIDNKYDAAHNKPYMRELNIILDALKKTSMDNFDPIAQYNRIPLGSSNTKDAVKEFKDAVDELKKAVKTSSSKPESKDIKAYLDCAEKYRGFVTKAETEKKLFLAIAAELEKHARMEHRRSGNDGEPEMVKGIRKCASTINEAFGAQARLFGVTNSVIRQCLTAASSLISKCMRKSNENEADFK